MNLLLNSATIAEKKEFKALIRIFLYVLIEADGYAKELSRYIHLNPVRAKLAETPEQYEWSPVIVIT